MKTLVTGGAGFIGSNLVRALLEAGHEVRVIDNFSTGNRANLLDVGGDVELVEGELRSYERSHNAVRGVEVVFHQGALPSVPRSVHDPLTTTAVNVEGTLNVLLAAQDVRARVVYASSSSIYGDREEFPSREEMEPRPKSPYAASKLSGELYCRTWFRGFGVRTVSLRYFNVYGPRQDPESEYAAVVPRFISACFTGTRPIIHGDGEQSRDFTYIDDIVAANLRAAGAGEEAWGGVFNIGGGREPTTINRVLELVAQETAASPDPVFEPPREGDIRMSQADISEAGRVLGYEPRISMAEGIRRTVEWFRPRVP